jgi:hypothetical protein
MLNPTAPGDLRRIWRWVAPPPRDSGTPEHENRAAVPSQLASIRCHCTAQRGRNDRLLRLLPGSEKFVPPSHHLAPVGGDLAALPVPTFLSCAFLR